MPIGAVDITQNYGVQRFCYGAFGGHLPYYETMESEVFLMQCALSFLCPSKSKTRRVLLTMVTLATLVQRRSQHC